MHLNAQGSSAPCRVQKSCLCTSALQICGQNYASQRRQSRTPSSNDFSPFSSPSSSPSSFRLTFYTTLSFPTVCLLFTPHILGPSPHSHSAFFFCFTQMGASCRVKLAVLRLGFLCSVSNSSFHSLFSRNRLTYSLCPRGFIHFFFFF